ncbi:MAG TPA: hypothetical protein VKR42_05905 [Ktedonobacteraceae bacterium]|nr:hypothetical protein [Ktedonobacteraceae bacterium]
MSDSLLRDYLKQIETYFKAGIATEHTYRPALQQLLTAYPRPDRLAQNVLVNHPKTT